MEIEEILEKIGLNKKEAKIYLAVLALGESTVLPIARKSGIQRTYCYDILNSLAQKGMVSYVEKRGRRRYAATEPKIVKRLLSDKLKEFDSVLPNLEGLYQKAPLRPKVRFFEGKEGIEILHEEILKETKEVWFFGSIADWARRFPNYTDYVKRQIDKGIRIRDLVRPNDPTPLVYQKFYKKGQQEMRILPESSSFNTDNMLWNNKFVMISYGADLYAVSIESAEIAQTMRIIYEILWKQAKKI
jgi:sugar-specific transcriptional regulator TrmB